MGMTNEQFKAFIRMALSILRKVLERHPDDIDLKEVIENLQTTLED